MEQGVWLEATSTAECEKFTVTLVIQNSKFWLQAGGLDASESNIFIGIKSG